MRTTEKRWMAKGAGMLGLLAAALLVACGGGGGGSASGTGTLQMSLTDAPACGYDHVFVDVQKLSIHQSATAQPQDAGWTDINVNQRIDLLNLTNGVLQTLGQVPLAAGQYQQIRLVLGANNTVTPTGGSDTPLKVPSGMQTGIKLNADITIAANKMADFVLDFDACKSVVSAGASGNYLLKPVIAVTPHFISGISGYVNTALASPNTVVAAEQNGVIVKSAAPLASGQFVLPVAPGTYDLVVESPGYATAVITGVTVTTDTVTTVAASTAALSPPTSTDGTASGTVTTPSTPIMATVDALQTLAGNHPIDVLSVNADGTTGAYAMSLPTAAPVVAAYSATATALAFSPDNSAAGKYSLVASSGGVSKPGVAVTISATTAVVTNFGF